VGQDYANLPVVGALLWSAVRLRNGSRRALFVWLGCLLYLIYAFAIYAFAVHFNGLFLAYVAVLGLSFYALVGGLAAERAEERTEPLRENPHRDGAGILLMLIGILFSGLWLAEIVPHILAGTTPDALVETGVWTNPVHVLDLAFLLPAMIWAGRLLRRQHPWGLLLAVPLLVFAVTMGLGILSMFTLYAIEGMPVAVPAAIAVGVIVLVSASYAWLLLRPQRASAAGSRRQ
jgi:hypothetical protein